MNSRAVSLPDLVTEKRRNTTMSLSEGFAGMQRQPALAGSAQNFAPKPVGAQRAAAGHATAGLLQILPIYYRTRQFVMAAEKTGHRVPRKLATELRAQEQTVVRELRPLHRLLFQRFDDLQLERLLRAMPFLRLSQGRWVFGGEGQDCAWKPACGECVFLLLCGRVSCFPELAGGGQKLEVREGSIFGEQQFRICDEAIHTDMAASARCEDPCTIGILSVQALETAFSDRAFGNRRIAQMVRNVPALTRIVEPEGGLGKDGRVMQQNGAEGSEDEAKKSGSIQFGLRDLSKIATAVHVDSGMDVLSEEPIDDNLLIVSKGGLEVRADVQLTERLESIPPKRVRLRLYIDRAEKLAGDSIFDKLDPYCIVQLGDFKRFQTPVLWNVGPNPKWEYNGCLTYNDESTLEFIVRDHDKFSADDLCGTGSLDVADLPDGWTGKVDLTRPKRGLFKSEQTLEEPAGKVFVTLRWDYEKITAASRTPKERHFPDQVLFTLKDQDCWGHEQLMLGNLFRRTLEQAAVNMKYALTLGRFRVIGSTPRGVAEICTCLKVPRKRFEEFVKQCAREKQFTQACRVSSLEKQSIIKELTQRLVKRWEQEELAMFLRGGVPEDSGQPEAMDPSRFKVAYRGVKAHITVRNALNLSGGSFFDKLDPYAILRFRGSKAEFRTSVLQDAGSDPIWNCEGTLVYGGETALEMSVWDYDKYSQDDLVATGILQHESFCNGFEGMVCLNHPSGKKRKAHQKKMMIIIGIQWDPPRDPNAVTGSTWKTFQTTGANMLANGTGMVSDLSASPAMRTY